MPTHRFPFEIKLPDGLGKALSSIDRAGGKCRIVGGAPRDALLEKSPKDFDIEVYGISIDHVIDALKPIGKCDLVGKSFCVIKLWTDGMEYDFSSPRRERKVADGHRGFAIEADENLSEIEAIQRRDFTINSIMYDPVSRELIDHADGVADLKRRVLRHIGPAFVEDPLRALRGVQFAGRFSMVLSEDTASICRKMKPEFWSLAKERIWEEWRKWATKSESLAHGLRALRASGWIGFFSELNALAGLKQDPQWHPEGDVWIHTLHCLSALEKSDRYSTLEGDDRCVAVFSVLCHDLGKARCTRFANKGGILRWISPGHDQESGWLARQFLTRINCPNSIIDRVEKLVRNHHFLSTGKSSIPSDSSLRRLSKRLEPANTHELLLLMQSDHLGRPPLISPHQSEKLSTFARRIEALDLAIAAPKPLLLGRHLIQLGLTPGKTFKPFLDDAYQAQLDGLFSDEPGAIDWAKKRLQPSQSQPLSGK